MTVTIPAVPKAELHNHLEATAPPALIRRLAERHGVAFPDGVAVDGERFLYRDFMHFLSVFDLATAVIRTAQDYRDVTYAYLIACARDGAIYVETMSSPDHAAQAGLSYADHVDGIAQGMADAEAETGIVSRLIITCVRHFGVERAHKVVDAAVRYPHPRVTGFGMGGDEAGFPPDLFVDVFRRARDEAGLQCTVHAGEWQGADLVRRAAEVLPVSRIGHGVRAIEIPDVVAFLAERGITLEVCPVSNVALGVYPDYTTHPLRALRDAGVAVTINTDDPPYFGTSLGYEYAVARDRLGFSDEELRAFSATAIRAAFVDEATRQRLLDKIGT